MIKLTLDMMIDVNMHVYTLLLDKHTLDKKGKPMYETLGYYTQLTTAIKAAREFAIRKNLSERDLGLTEAIVNINRISKEFEVLLYEKVGGEDESQNTVDRH